MEQTSYLHTQTIVRALEFALSKGGFGNNARHKKTAQTLLKSMESNRSVSGRHQQLVNMLKKGASIEQMMKSANSSRRTVFRYLNHYEAAGMDIQLEDGKYRLKD